jgi:hypothetical protein
MNIHWRYNYDFKTFDWVDGNPKQNYQPLMDYVTTPTLIIDINLVNTDDLESYLNFVLDEASKNNNPIIFKQLIFDATHDPVYNYKEKTEIINNFIKNKGIPGFLSLSQFELTDHSHLVEILYPSWLFSFKKQKLPELNLKQKQWKYSCLNRNPAWHRFIFYTLIKERNLLDQFVYTFYDRCPYSNRIVDSTFFSKLESWQQTSEFFDEYYNKCMKNIPDLPLLWPNDIPGSNDHSLNHDAYINTECNIVTETSASISFTSEKIWKPIAAGQIFHVVGSAHTNKWLQSLGFYTFDTGYDSIIDNIQRIKTVADLLNGETMWNQENLFQIEHNYHWFHSGNADYKLIHEALKILQIGK